jgi:hypothetical protein
MTIDEARDLAAFEFWADKSAAATARHLGAPTSVFRFDETYLASLRDEWGRMPPTERDSWWLRASKAMGPPLKFSASDVICGKPIVGEMYSGAGNSPCMLRKGHSGQCAESPSPETAT